MMWAIIEVVLMGPHRRTARLAAIWYPTRKVAATRMVELPFQQEESGWRGRSPISSFLNLTTILPPVRTKCTWKREIARQPCGLEHLKMSNESSRTQWFNNYFERPKPLINHQQDQLEWHPVEKEEERAQPLDRCCSFIAMPRLVSPNLIIWHLLQNETHIKVVTKDDRRC